jgi:hypothetical protein
MAQAACYDRPFVFQPCAVCRARELDVTVPVFCLFFACFTALISSGLTRHAVTLTNRLSIEVCCKSVPTFWDIPGRVSCGLMCEATVQNETAEEVSRGMRLLAG